MHCLVALRGMYLGLAGPQGMFTLTAVAVSWIPITRLRGSRKGLFAKSCGTPAGSCPHPGLKIG